MKKNEIEKEMLAGNNTLSFIIVRIDFLTIEVEKLVEEILVELGDQYIYNKINNYGINLDISDPRTLITQDFIKQKVNLKSNYEFRNNNENFRFVINENFFLYERRDFKNYEGSDKDTSLYNKLLKKIFYSAEIIPKIQRIGVRKRNEIFLKQDISFLKRISDNGFINSLNDSENQRFNLMYTPMGENQKDGYNINTQVDYGKIGKKGSNEESKDVYKLVVDIDSYMRDVDKIKDYESVKEQIDNLKIKDFTLYKEQMSEEFLNIIIKSNKEEFYKELKEIGIISGVNYGKHG